MSRSTEKMYSSRLFHRKLANCQSLSVTPRHDADNIRKAAISHSLSSRGWSRRSWNSGTPEKPSYRRRHFGSELGTERDGEPTRQTSHQAQFRGRLFSRPSKQSAAISSGGQWASDVRMYKRSRDGVPEATRCRTLSPRQQLVCGQIAISRPIPRGSREPCLNFTRYKWRNLSKNKIQSVLDHVMIYKRLQNWENKKFKS